MSPIRFVLIVCVAASAALLGSAALGGPEARAELEGKKDCGTYESFSIYERGHVFSLRDVGCPKARKVAKRYDHEAETPGRWRCALSRTAGRALFSCGRGGSGGDLRDYPHAFVVKGVGRPT